MKPTVILLTGQYGTSHDEVATTLCKMANRGFSRYSSTQTIAKPYSIDHKLWEKTGGPEAFFELPNDKSRDDWWHDAFTEIADKIESDNPLFAIVSLHIVYLWKKRFFSCVDWDRLVTLQPRVILTLIDDIYDVHTRIVATQQRRGVRIPKGSFSLSEILSWRLREIHTCNLIAKHLYVNPKWFPSINSFLINQNSRGEVSRKELHNLFSQPCDHFVISVKQNPEDFYRLLFDRKKLRVYLSFPISKPRKNKDSGFFDELLAWRKKIHEKCTAFDPLAIDELRFDKDENGRIKTGKLGDRIEYGIGTPIVFSPQDTHKEWPVQDLESIRELLVQQVGERDLKLTSQVNLVTMYRPLYGNETHDGVNVEGEFAKAKGISLHSYHPSVDNVEDKPFEANIGVDHKTPEELFNVIKELQKEWEKQQKEVTYSSLLNKKLLEKRREK